MEDVFAHIIFNYWFETGVLALLFGLFCIAACALQRIEDLHKSIVGDQRPQNRMLMELGYISSALGDIDKKLSQWEFERGVRR